MSWAFIYQLLGGLIVFLMMAIIATVLFKFLLLELLTMPRPQMQHFQPQPQPMYQPQPQQQPQPPPTYAGYTSVYPPQNNAHYPQENGDE